MRATFHRPLTVYQLPPGWKIRCAAIIFSVVYSPENVNCLRPAAKFPNFGDMIFDTRTLSRRPTALLRPPNATKPLSFCCVHSVCNKTGCLCSPPEPLRRPLRPCPCGARLRDRTQSQQNNGFVSLGFRARSSFQRLYQTNISHCRQFVNSFCRRCGHGGGGSAPQGICQP